MPSIRSPGIAVALRLLREVGLGRVALDRGAHPVEVVLDQEEDRQPPERRQVHRLAEVAGVGGAVAEHADGDRVFALVLGGEREAGRDRQVAADDPVAAHEAALGVEDVHRAAAPAAGPVDPAEELRHHPLGVGAAGDRVAVGAVGADQVVLLAHRRGGADDRRLLADREVQEAAGLRPLVLAPRLLLEAADQRHPREQLVTGRRRRARSAIGPVDLIRLRRPADRLLEPVVAPEDLARRRRRVGTPVTPSSPARSVASRRASLTLGLDRLQQRPAGAARRRRRRSARCRARSRSRPAANAWRKAARAKETVRPVCLAKVAARIANSVLPGQGSGQRIGGSP